jgi:hypothetical protein
VRCRLLHDLTGVDKGLALTDGRQLVIKVIAIEELLDRVSSQHKLVLFELFILDVLPLLIDIFLIKVVLFWWHKGGLHPSFE